MAEKADKIKISSKSQQQSKAAHPSFVHTKAENTFFTTTPSASSFIQPKLQISKPDDPMEKEADATADKVMRMSAPAVQPASAQPPDDDLHRKCADCEKENKLQRKEEDEEVQPKLSVNGQGALIQRVEENDEPVQAKEEEEVQRKYDKCGKEEKNQPSYIQKLNDDNKNEKDESINPKLSFLARKERGPPQTSTRFVKDLHSSHSGRAMDNGTRSFMESRFSADFSQVRLHTDAKAVQLSSQINAQAFTHGNNIYFNSGKYNPATESGKHLLAHELTHTIQQGKSRSDQSFLTPGVQRNTEEKEIQAKQQDEEDPAIQRVEEETIQAKQEPGSPKVRPELRKAVAFAKSQIGKVNAQQKNADGSRIGWERLRDYFQTAMGKENVIPEGSLQTPGSILEKNIKYGGTVKAPPPNVVPTPPEDQWVKRDIMPSWCGIFVFWALNKGGVPMPKWSIGGSAVKQKAAYAPGYIPKPGDIAYFNKNSHYAIVEKTEPENPSPSERKKVNVVTVNGNTAGEDNLGGQVQVKTHSIAHWHAFFDPLYGVLDKMPSNPEEVSDAELQKIIGDAVAAAKSSAPVESKPAGIVPYTPPKTETKTEPAAETITEPLAEETTEAVAEAPPVAEVVIESSPKTPAEDPAYQEIIGKTKTAKSQQKKHDTPESKANAAQMASQIPDETHIGSQAKMHQTGDMSNQQAQKFNAQAFKDKLMERVKQALPKNDQETVDMYEHPSDGKKRMEEAKSNAKGDVKAEKENAANAIASTTGADPATKNSLAEKKEVVPMENEDAGKKPYIPNAEATAPKPKTEGEISMEKDAQALDHQMAESNVTEEQLAKSNEPEFTGALKSKQDAQQEARNAPAEYREQEQPMIGKAEENAKATVAGKMEDIHGVRADMFGKVDTAKTGTKAKDEEKRKQIAKDMEDIYSTTKTNVEKILSQLEKEVTDDFDAAANSANAVFEKKVNERLDDFYGITTVDDTISEYFSGLDPEIDKIFREERDRYVQNMDGAINAISEKVAKQLNDAMAEIKTGKDKISEYWKNLSPELQKIGEDAKTEVLGKFDELEQSVEDKHEALIQKLSDKYVQNVNKLQETFDKIKDSKKGWLSKAVDAIAGVIKTILRLKDMLFETLAKVAHVIGQIISDPIGFLSNLVDAVKMGLNNFIDNIATHFKKGFFEWLMGNMPPGIVFPDKWDLVGIFHFVMQILGLTWVNIRQRAVKKLGEPVVAALEEVFEIFQIVRKEGLPGLWRYIKEKIGDLKVMVIDAIQSFLIEKIVKAGIMWVIGLLNPAGAFIKACKLIYDIVMFFVENGKRILDLINAIIDGVALIVQGSLTGAAKLVENALAKLIPITLGFLAALLGLSGITEKVQKIIKAIQAPINKAIDWVLDKAIALSKKLGLDKIVKKIKGGVQGAKDWAKKKMEKGKEKVKNLKEKLIEWWKSKKPVSVDGESHTLYFEGSGANSKLMMRSTAITYRQFVSDLNVPATEKQQLLNLADEIDKKLAGYGKVKQEDRKKWGDDLVDLMNRVASMTEKYAGAEEKDPHTIITWGKTTSEVFGTSFNAKQLSEKYVSGEPAADESKAVYGWDIARGRKMFAQSGEITSVYVKGHLLNDNLGGKANVTNLTPITNQANKDHVNKVESKVKKIVTGEAKKTKKSKKGPKGVANYEVIAIYDKHAVRSGLKAKYEADNRELRQLQSQLRKNNDPDAAIKITNIDRGIETNTNLILLLDYEEHYLPTSLLCRWQPLVFDKTLKEWKPDPAEPEQTVNVENNLPSGVEAYQPVVKQFTL
jgi:hypothetical protein